VYCNLTAMAALTAFVHGTQPAHSVRCTPAGLNRHQKRLPAGSARMGASRPGARAAASVVAVTAVGLSRPKATARSIRRQARLVRRYAAEEDEDLADDMDGAMCSIWLDADNRSIAKELLATPAGALLDNVQTLRGEQVRGCRKRAKQVATLGPASSSEEMIEQLFLCGVDVFRLNFSHGEYDEKTELVEKIRKLEARYMHPICILADMQGPKQRCGKFEDPDGVELQNGQSFRFDMDPALGTESRAQLPHPEILKALMPGKTLLLDDGKIRMRVVKKGCTWQGKDMDLSDGSQLPSDDVLECPPYIECEVTVAGRLGARKGVNTPDVLLEMSPITPKDKKDIAFACQSDVDWIAMSFVQKHEDMEELRRLVKEMDGPQPKLLAKIEKPSAVEDIDQILASCDGIMVARGDLGVEMSPEEVPFVQKELITKARQAGKPVIVATQMLESMISNPMPTRAECSDVANAILDGCDAVMLSGESAVGKYPAECVAMQRRVIENAERQLNTLPIRSASEQAMAPSEATLASASALAKNVHAKALVVYTATGRSAQLLVQEQPGVPIIAVCPCLETARWLSMLRGVYATSDPSTQELASRVETEGAYTVRFNEGVEVACRLARERGLAAKEEDWVVVVARLPLFSKGPLNTIRMAKAEGPSVADGYGPEQ